MTIIFGNKNFNELTESDIQNLIDNQEEESIILEFKRELGSNSKEIAKDFSAMANSEGGIIIYGLDEDENNKAKEIMWIGSSECLEEKIENVLSTTLNPQISFKIYPICKDDDTTKQVYAVLIPKSRNLHMVIKDRDNRYYKRLGKTIQRMEASEIRERIRIILSYEEDQKNVIKKLNEDIVQLGGINLNSIKRINYFIIPDELNNKITSIDSLKSVVDGLDITDLHSGITLNSYGSTITHTNHSNDDKFKSCIIFHKNGVIEYRRSHDVIGGFASSLEAEKILKLIKLTNQLYEKTNYFGGYNLYLEIGNLGKFWFNPTFENIHGEHLVSVGSFIENIELESVLTQTDEKNSILILELIKMLGGNLGISGEGHYARIKSVLGIEIQNENI